MLEGEYLEMANQLKEEFDKKDEELKEAKQKYSDMVRIFISIYGFIRITDGVTDPMEKDGLLEILRGYLSDRFDDIILPYYIEDE